MDRPGIYTSEFWVSILTPLGTLLVAWGLDLNVEEMVAVTAPFVAYIVSRGWAKSGTSSRP